ncbi:MAG: hypothetical protein J0M33_26380 [Anaerolineae bacterium]|nr:hypothetical protein [Anaerolineae bacterium]
MRASLWVVIVVALVVVAAIVVVGQQLVQPPRGLIANAGFSPEVISPNADGTDDVTVFSYTLHRNARISIRLTSSEGQSFYFRENEARIPNDYSVQFSGVVDGYTLPNETLSGEPLRRLVPDGDYIWTLEAVDEAGERAELSGKLQVVDGDAVLPELVNFSISPTVFSPNQDGIADRTQMTVYLPKDATLLTYLVGASGEQIFVPESLLDRKDGEPGRHSFDYDGGIDLGVEPPPDGDYQVVIEAMDAEGQQMRVTSQITIENGGEPQAEISTQPNGIDVLFTTAPYEDRYLSTMDIPGEAIAQPEITDDLGFSSITMPVGDLLVFQLTVENYGRTPIRTSGPWAGTVYQWDQVFGAMGEYEQSGSWRVGIQCSTSSSSWPYRWGLGQPDSLHQIESNDGNTYYYLLPGERAVVWGAVRMTELIAARNPQQCWAGLIHEDVAVPNPRVGARDILLTPLSS